MVSHATLWFRTIAKNILSMSHKQIRVYSLIIDVTGKYTLRKTHTSWCKLKSYGDTDLERRILKAVDSIKNLYHFSLIKNVKRVNKMMDLNREIFFSLLTESTKKNIFSEYVFVKNIIDDSVHEYSHMKGYRWFLSDCFCEATKGNYYIFRLQVVNWNVCIWIYRSKKESISSNRLFK